MSDDRVCTCNRGPTSDGPEEDCPIDGRPYAYWVERSDELSSRLARVEALADLYDSWDGTRPHPGESSPRQRADLRAALATPADEKAACVPEAAQDSICGPQPRSGVYDGHQQHAGPRECCASGRCEVCTPGYDWGRDG